MMYRDTWRLNLFIFDVFLYGYARAKGSSGYIPHNYQKTYKYYFKEQKRKLKFEFCPRLLSIS